MKQRSGSSNSGAPKQGPEGSLITLVIIILVSILISGLLTSCTLLDTDRETTETTAGEETRTADSADRLFGAVSDAAERVKPSVVSINVGGDGRGGVGSGVVYRENGYIITNNHVVSGARRIVVTIGSSEVNATLVAADPETDLAVIRVNRSGLDAAEFGSVGNLEVGNPVVAIGNPFGFEYSVTFGIISALNRDVAVPGRQNGRSVVYTDLIQTDAAINPGNSGGALCNIDGQVIGINTLIITESGAFNGIGFAIPADTVTNIADQLIRNRRASHPYIGITGRNVGDLPEDSDINVDEGVVIVEVVSGGPAARAGLRAGDVITELDNEPIEDLTDLIATIREKEVGDTVEITYLRGGRSNTAELTLAERPRQ